MKTLSELESKHILVLGAGISGQSSVRFLLARGISPVWRDTREESDVLDKARAQVPGAELLAGALTAQDFEGVDLVVLSPGIPRNTPEIAAAEAAGLAFISDVELFAQLCDKPVIAITGSNGKSTVTAWCEHVLKACGFNALAAGNIGLPVLDALAQDADCYVLELSSFQLEGVQSLAPISACVLNLSEDHLDWHGSMQAYQAAKLRIYRQAERQVYNLDDKATYPDPLGRGVSFGLNPSANFTLLMQDDEVYLSKGRQLLQPVSDLLLAGQHNWLNALAVLALVEPMVESLNQVLTPLANYTGLPHRMQPVGNWQGVQWINDSKATNAGAVEAALKGVLPQVEGTLHLIMGGDAKGADISCLKPYLGQAKVRVIGLGKDAERFIDLAKNALLVESMEQAVSAAYDQAKPGDWVLLSPACASIDMFANYMQRGERFAQSVEAVCLPG